MSFTPEMGERIERIASEEDLYASTLIREIVEVYVIEQEGRMRGISEDRIETNMDKLRAELIGLNEDIMARLGHRDTIQMRLAKASRKDEEDED